jgi:type IX secretion system PorP/SprF family membrane protein
MTNQRKHIVLIALLLALSQPMLIAQQQSLFSHYFWNEQVYNPAYAGSKEVFHMQALYRLQWAGFEGAPQTFNAAFHSPLKNERLALGVNFYNDRIGAYQANGFTFQYAYRVPLTDKIKLSLGLQGGMEFGNLDIGRLTTDDGLIDPVQSNWNPNSLTPVVGTGLYLYGEQFSFGFGVPQLLNSRMLKNEQLVLIPDNHFFFSGAYQFNVSDDVRLLPTSTFRVSKAAPLQAEFNVSAILYDMFQAGLGYRTDKSLILMAQIHAKLGDKQSPFRVGYAYDIAAQPLRTNTNGSHELMISFGLRPKITQQTLPKITSPRYF